MLRKLPINSTAKKRVTIIQCAMGLVPGLKLTNLDQYIYVKVVVLTEGME